MDEIFSLVQSPGWWFTTFVAAVLVAFLKDAINRVLARSFVWYRQWRAAALSHQESEIEFLSRDPAVLTLYNLRAVILFLWAITLFLLFLLFVLAEGKISSSSSLPETMLNHNTRTTFVRGTMIVIALLTNLALFRFAARSVLCIRANSRLYDRRKAEFERNAGPPIQQ